MGAEAVEDDVDEVDGCRLEPEGSLVSGSSSFFGDSGIEELSGSVDATAVPDEAGFDAVGVETGSGTLAEACEDEEFS